jgi:hypothetical protein
MELEIQGMTINQTITQTTTMRLKGNGSSKSGSSDKNVAACGLAGLLSRKRL